MKAEIVTIKKIPKGLTALYFVKDVSHHIGKTSTWEDSKAKLTILRPNGQGFHEVEFDDNSIGRKLSYFIVGCFTGKADFKLKISPLDGAPLLVS